MSCGHAGAPEVGVHQGSVLSPLLFIIVLQAITEEFKTGYPWDIYIYIYYFFFCLVGKRTRLSSPPSFTFPAAVAPVSKLLLLVSLQLLLLHAIVAAADGGREKCYPKS
ncbi:Hypothetical predicted protein [Octopus vulgaris]|uniref:Uncharacterized protein n=1 Tax=Octopus vulgaris TaxID=6645 RepID=A0AA36BNJ7_OCTVU|nr:Hypothetical predicted protein [Octopus vulgaris]